MTKSKSVIATVALALAGVLGIGYVGASVWRNSWNPTEWVRPKTEIVTPGNTNNGESDSNFILSDGESNGISLMSALVAPEEYEDYGVNAQTVDSVYTLTATVTPESAGNQSVNWSVSWNDPSSEWASGKTVTDYVTVTPVSDGALTATVACQKDFGEQIKITVASRESSEYSADCICNYVKKIMGFHNYIFDTVKDPYHSTEICFSNTMNSYTFSSPFFGNLGFVTPTYSEYTVDDTFTSEFKSKLTTEYLNYFRSANIRTNSNSTNGYVTTLLWGGTHAFCCIIDGEQGTSFCGLTPTNANKAIEVAKAHTDVPVYNITFTWTGEHSTYSHTIEIYFAESSLIPVVTGVSLDNSSLTF